MNNKLHLDAREVFINSFFFSKMSALYPTAIVSSHQYIVIYWYTLVSVYIGMIFPSDIGCEEILFQRFLNS